MNDTKQSRLQQLEMLYSEQEFTIQSLSDTVARQDREIANLRRGLEQLENRIQNLQNESGGGTDAADEKPPHY